MHMYYRHLELDEWIVLRGIVARLMVARLWHRQCVSSA